MRMSLKHTLLLARNVQRTILGTHFLRTLTNNGGNNNSTIRDGILYSDSSDVNIPSVNLLETIYERIETYQKFTAIVSILKCPNKLNINQYT